MLGVSGIPVATLKSITLVKGGTLTFTVPAGHRYYLSFASFNYVADANVATRIVTIYLDHGTPETHFCKFDVTASQNLRTNIGILNAAYAAYLVAGTNTGGQLLPMAAGDVFNVGVSNGQAGDAWTAYVRVYDVVVGS